MRKVTMSNETERRRRPASSESGVGISASSGFPRLDRSVGMLDDVHQTKLGTPEPGVNNATTS